MEQERTRFGLEIPALGSLILTHSLDKQVPALKEFPKEDRPNSTIVFWSFRIMAGLGMLMLLLGVRHSGCAIKSAFIPRVLSCGLPC
jgi:cytochrome d ubiquinol oxidase subunit I